MCVSTHSSPSVEGAEASAKEGRCSASSSALVQARDVVWQRQGTPHVSRYCLSGRRKSWGLEVSPFSLLISNSVFVTRGEEE